MLFQDQPMAVTDILFFRASSSQAPRSSKSDLPDSMARTAIRAPAQVSSVCAPRQGTSNRMSWFNFVTFTAIAPPSLPASSPPRARHLSVPGTDKCLARGGELAGKDGGAIAVKVTKLNHDMRFDVPCLGAQTLETCAGARIAVLAIESGKSLLLERGACEEL